MRLLIFAFHMTFITSLEDHLQKKTSFLYLGKDLEDEYKLDVCDKFNNSNEVRVILIDMTQDLSCLEFTTPNTIILFAEVFWNEKLMMKAENVIQTQGIKSAANILYLFGRYTLDEYIFKYLYKMNRDLYHDLEPLQLDL